MSLPIILRRAARAEFDAAGDRYESLRKGLGMLFTKAVQRVFDRISERPQIHQIVYRDVRRAVVKGFPFCIYYRERPSAVVVIAVSTPLAIHRSGNPDRERSPVISAQPHPQALLTRMAALGPPRGAIVTAAVADARFIPRLTGSLVELYLSYRHPLRRRFVRQNIDIPLVDSIDMVKRSVCRRD